jgi:dolichol-phosphate mannosyltransferase
MDNILTQSIHLGIICPMANEQDTAERFTKEILRESDTVKKVTLFVILDNSCTDNTLDIERRLAEEDERIHVVWAPENKCVVDAYIRGYEVAVQANCDWILEIDAGYSHQPSDMHKFFKKLNSGNNYDCILGSRFCKGGGLSELPLGRFILSKWGTIVSNLLLGTNLSDMTSGYQLFKREVLQMVLDKGIQSRGHFFQTEMKAFCSNMNLTEVPIHYKSPSSNMNLKIIMDAYYNLIRLFKMRVSGKLYL